MRASFYGGSARQNGAEVSPGPFCNPQHEVFTKIRDHGYIERSFRDRVDSDSYGPKARPDLVVHVSGLPRGVNHATYQARPVELTETTDQRGRLRVARVDVLEQGAAKGGRR